MSEKLKPCPFCGEVPNMESNPGSYGYRPPSLFIKCCNGILIHADTEEYDWEKRGHVDTEEKAIKNIAERWNTRAEESEG